MLLLVSVSDTEKDQIYKAITAAKMDSAREISTLTAQNEMLNSQLNHKNAPKKWWEIFKSQ